MRVLIVLALLAGMMPGVAQASIFCVCLECVLGTHKRYEALSGSMLPTFEGGECAIARRRDALVTPVEPGDVIAFRHAVTDATYLKRIVAVAGDRVQMRDGVLFVNGEAARRDVLPEFEQVYGRLELNMRGMTCNPPVSFGEVCSSLRHRETLANGRSYEVLSLRVDAPGDNTAKFEVPEGMVFVLGDNRDVSNDSRFETSIGGVGLVPLTHVVGIFEGR